MINVMTAIFERLGDHERRLAAMDIRGPVTDVDVPAGKARIQIGEDEDGNPVKSPWTRYAQTAGAMKVHAPPTVGQTMTLRGSSGDVEQGSLEPFHWSDDNKSPSSSGNDRVFSFGGVTISVSDGKITISGDIDHTGNLDTKGGHLHHEGTDVGKTHKHTEVTPGSGLSGVPE